MARNAAVLWLSVFVALAAFWLSGCGPVPAPQPPTPPQVRYYALDVQVSSPRGGEAGIIVQIQDGPNKGTQATTGATGEVMLPRLIWTPTQQAFTICALKTDHTSEKCAGIDPFDHSQDVTLQVLYLPPVPPVRRIVTAGRFLVAEGESHPFVWRYATGFRLLDYLADGDLDSARRFIAWLVARGFNGVRVLATAQVLFQLDAADGLRALPQLFDELKNGGLNVEIVALADTASWTNAQLETQVKAVDAQCASHPGCVLEIANEHYTQTQSRSLHDLNYLNHLLTLTTTKATAISSAAHDEDLAPAGRYVTRHRDRHRDKWNDVRRVREMNGVSDALDVFTVDDEPIGANEVAQFARRENDPAIFFTQGVLCRVMSVGCTFHFEDGLQAKVPGPVQDLCAQRFIEGMKIVPDSWVLTYKNATWTDSPVRSADFTKVVRVYSGVEGNHGIMVALGLTGDPQIVMQNGWTRGVELAHYDGVTVWRISK